MTPDNAAEHSNPAADSPATSESSDTESLVSLGKELASETGFECIGSMEAAKLEVRPEVRDMCAADRCRSYARSWTCPPACGELEGYRKAIEGRRAAVLVQTVAELEDDFDFEGMQDAAKLHEDRFRSFASAVRERWDARDGGEPLFLGAGACTFCPECSYPESPCRFPDQAHVSMEAAGLVVGDTCRAASIPYNHGPQTACYTGCMLV